MFGHLYFQENLCYDSIFIVLIQKFFLVFPALVKAAPFGFTLLKDVELPTVAAHVEEVCSI